MKHYFSNSELRNIIEGKTLYKKCPICNGNGFEIIDAEGNVLQKETEDSSKEICENCEGLKYVLQCYCEDEDFFLG